MVKKLIQRLWGSKKTGRAGRALVAVVASVAMMGSAAVVSTAMAADANNTTTQTQTVNSANNSAPAQQAATPSAEADEGVTLLEEDFTGTSVDAGWKFLGDACLTAIGLQQEGVCGKRTDTRDYTGETPGFLQLTDGANVRTGTVLYDNPVQSKLGLDISFYQYQFHGTNPPADGIGFFLTDGSYTLDEPGPTGSGVGGALGYSAIMDSDSQKTVAGIPNGVLGVGLDTFGNFSAKGQVGGDDVRQSGDSSENHRYSVTVRGEGKQNADGEWKNGYGIIDQTSNSTIRNLLYDQDGPQAGVAGHNGGTLVNVKLSVPDENGIQHLTVTLTGENGNVVTAIDTDLKKALPDLIKFGFTASTGANNAVHFVRGVTAKTVLPPTSGILLTKAVDHRAGTGTDKQSFEVGDEVPYQFMVQNVGGTTLTNVTVKDDTYNDAATSCPSNELKPGEQMICTAKFTLAEEQVTGSAFTNTATAYGTPEGETKQITSQASVDVPTIKPLGAPDHSKKIKKNDDGTYALALDVVGDSTESTETTTQPLDIVLVLDTSGSMSNKLDAEYVYSEAYSINTNGRTNYYVKQDDGTYVQVDRITTGSWLNPKFDHWEVNGRRVEPKTSSSDSDSDHIQFYKRNQKQLTRMEALQEAAGNFIDSTAEQNASLSADLQHRISIVSFSTNGHIRQQLTECIDSNASQMKNIVNNLDTDGDTYPERAMNSATEALKVARSNAKKVVIFFTDGNPAPKNSNDFNVNMANAGIQAAKSLKDDKTTIYSIGVFDTADPSNTATNNNNQFNAYMHAMSSNYPNATAWNNLGTRAPGSDYYKAAKNSDELNKIFEEIQQTITSGTAYSNVSITDQLSEYAEQSGIEYDEETEDGNGFYKVTKGVTLTVTDGSGAKQEFDQANFTLLFNPSGNGTVKVQFAEGYKLQKKWKYTLTYNVKPTPEAYEEYAKNGYGNIVGDKDTDLDTTNPTSDGKPGFHSNDHAEVTYTANGKVTESDYDHPVLQVNMIEVDGSWFRVRKTVPNINTSTNFDFEMTPNEKDANNNNDQIAWADSNVDNHKLTAEVTEDFKVPDAITQEVNFDGKFEVPAAEGTYVFSAKETSTTDDTTWAYDEDMVTVTLKVLKDGEGKFTHKVEYSYAENDPDGIDANKNVAAFTNKSVLSVSYSPFEITKELDGAKLIKNLFDFKVWPGDDKSAAKAGFKKGNEQQLTSCEGTGKDTVCWFKNRDEASSRESALAREANTLEFTADDASANGGTGSTFTYYYAEQKDDTHNNVSAAYVLDKNTYRVDVNVMWADATQKALQITTTVKKSADANPDWDKAALASKTIEWTSNQTGDKPQAEVPFVNKFVQVSSLPLTGGRSGRDWLVYGGGVGAFALLLVGATGIWRNRRRVI